MRYIILFKVFELNDSENFLCLLRIRINRFWEGALHCHQSTEGVSDTAFFTDFQVEVCENGSHYDGKDKPELLKELK